MGVFGRTTLEFCSDLSNSLSADPSMTVRADINGRYGNRLYAYEPTDMGLCEWIFLFFLLFFPQNAFLYTQIFSSVFSNMEKAKKLLKSELWGAAASCPSWRRVVTPGSGIPQKTAHCKVSSPLYVSWIVYICVTATVHYQLCWINALLLTCCVTLLTDYLVTYVQKQIHVIPERFHDLNKN